MKKTKKLTLSALCAAMCVAILSVGSVVETLDISLALISGVIIMIMDTEFGPKVATSVFLVAGILSLLLPVKSPAILFLALLGWYPILRKKINLLKPFFARLLKILLFNLVLGFLLWFSFFVTGIPDPLWVNISLFIMGNICFYLYDFLLDRFFLYYILKIRKRLRF